MTQHMTGIVTEVLKTKYFNENDFNKFFEDKITDLIIEEVAQKFMDKDLKGFSTIKINQQNISFIELHYLPESNKLTSIEGIVSKNLLSSVLKKPVSFKIFLRSDFFSEYMNAKKYAYQKSGRDMDYYRGVVRGMFNSPMKSEYSSYFIHFYIKMTSFLYNITFSWN